MTFQWQEKNFIFLYFSLHVSALLREWEVTFRAILRVVALSCASYCSSSYYLPVTTVCISFETWKMYFALITFHMLFLVLPDVSTKSAMYNCWGLIKNYLVISLNTSMQIALLLQESHQWCFAFFCLFFSSFFSSSS